MFVLVLHQSHIVFLLLRLIVMLPECIPVPCIDSCAHTERMHNMRHVPPTNEAQPANQPIRLPSRSRNSRTPSAVRTIFLFSLPPPPPDRPQITNESNKGMYFSLFQGLIALHLVPGNIASHFLLKTDDVVDTANNETTTKAPDPLEDMAVRRVWCVYSGCGAHRCLILRYARTLACSSTHTRTFARPFTFTFTHTHASRSGGAQTSRVCLWCSLCVVQVV
jgi:hypothetical protein